MATASQKQVLDTRLSAEDALAEDEWHAEQAHKQRLRAWIKKFEATTPWQKVLRELDRVFPPDHKTDLFRTYFPLRDRVLDSCYRASVFSRSTDPHQEARHETHGVLGEIKSQQDAIDTLRRFLEKGKTARNAIRRRTASTAFRKTILDLKRNGILITQADNGSLTRAAILDRILEAYSAELDTAIQSSMVGGRVADPCSYGCLRYPKPLDRRKRQPDVETMLLFDLVLTFRLQSQEKSRAKRGQKMPKGKPHYPLATDFVKATFNSVRTTRKPKTSENLKSSLKNLIRANPELKFAGWPRSREGDN